MTYPPVEIDLDDLVKTTISLAKCAQRLSVIAGHPQRVEAILASMTEDALAVSPTFLTPEEHAHVLAALLEWEAHL
jgi:uncharacterized membrane protein